MRERIWGRHKCNISEPRNFETPLTFRVFQSRSTFPGHGRTPVMCVCMCVTRVVRVFLHFASCKPPAHSETHRVQRRCHTHILLPTAPPCLLSMVRCDEYAELPLVPFTTSHYPIQTVAIHRVQKQSEFHPLLCKC
jgi:hypothetical protein